MSTEIEPSLFAKLKKVFGKSQVYPNSIPMKDGEDLPEPDTALPAIAYRLVQGTRGNSINTGATSFREDNYLVEIFGRDIADLSEIRERFMREFQGPPDPNKPGWPVQWVDGGPKVRWAEVSDPSSETDFATNDAHDALAFVQLLLTIQYHAARRSKP